MALAYHTVAGRAFGSTERRLVLGETGDAFARRAKAVQSMTKAIVDIRRIEEYCLNPSHPLGRNKARELCAALDVQQGDAAWLRDVLLIEAARIADIPPIATEAWGTYWVFDVTLKRHSKSAVLLVMWIVPPGEIVPIFVTCWVV
jgi:hypothetical protein